jgi:hypothetical protein
MVPLDSGIVSSLGIIHADFSEFPGMKVDHRRKNIRACGIISNQCQDIYSLSDK